MENFHLSIDQLIRSVEANKDDNFTLFLGAGASLTSGIPTATDCIWEWKKSIYITKKPKAPANLNIKTEQVKNMIQTWLDTEKGYPALWSDDEYSFYCEKCYPIADDRRAYFQRLCEGKTPSVGYRIIALLNEMGLINSVWTTNFDDLCADAIRLNGGTVIDVPLDATSRVDRAENKKDLVLVKLHGDYRYGATRNTSAELQEQDSKLRQVLIHRLRDKHLIVSGYSARDQSIMDALKEAYSQPGGGRLYWCGRGRDIPPRVKDLIQVAQQNGRTAFYIDTEGFDELFISLANFCTKTDSALHSKYLGVIKAIETVVPASKFTMSIPYANSAIKSNLLGIDFPEEAYRFDINLGRDEKWWKTLRELTKNSNLVAVPYKGGVWSLGTIPEINKIFGSRLKGRIQRVSLADVDVHKETALYRLLLTSLLELLAKKHNLGTDRQNILWNKSTTTQTRINNVIYFTHEAVRLSITADGSKNYLTIQPDFYISVEVPGTPIGKEIYFEIGRGYFEKKWNKEYNEYVDNWRNLLIGKPGLVTVELEYPANSASGFIFKINTTPVYAGIYNDSLQEKSLPANFPASLLKREGIKYSEPQLLFAPKHTGMTQLPKDFHPMRGIVQNRPYDFEATPTTINNTIQLGVICPASDAKEFSQFLQQHRTNIDSKGQNKAYLISFPGFQEAFSANLNVPLPDTSNWKDCPEPGASHSIKDNAKVLRDFLLERIDGLAGDGIKKVIVIYIPDRWLTFTSYDIDNEHYDLHDFIKAYCAQRQIATQFIQEKTLKGYMQCQINWWLSLSYFVKSMRTPWVLDSLDKNTAFAGIGYSVSRKSDTSEIVLGCSHIYNSQGQGLKYRLSKVDDDLVWDHHKNPHLSYNDAFKLGISTISLFYDTMNELPKRVVIHKRTGFSPDEINGLKDSLLNAGVKELDLIEINFEQHIRYVASRMDRHEGKMKIDGYSVDRGTCILLNEHEALLWTHGVVQSVEGGGRKFYLGGRYIPSPIRIKKHYGNSNIGQISTEILGLTKMNWNSFDLYSQLPATVNSSNEIARIGKLLSKRQGVTYDYRYFI